VKELIELVAKKLVDHPEDVQVNVVAGEEGQTIELITHPDDVGRVIGKSGKTAQAIRVLLSMAATKANVRVSLRIVDVNGAQSSEVSADDSTDEASEEVEAADEASEEADAADAASE
jgi:predicted RNA-binding protein YlqC (UPF0109 family)